MGKIQSIDGYFPVSAEPLMFPDRRRQPARQTTSTARATWPVTRTESAARMHLVEALDRPASAAAGIRLLPANAATPALRHVRPAYRAFLLDAAFLGTALALAAALWWTLL